jgi:tetratricopeptide (TPR) repeat protein
LQATGPSTDLAAIQEKIVGKRFVDALGDLDTVLQTDPDHRDALYMRAVCCRYLRRFEQAQVTLDKLKTLAPDHSRAHQEEGHTYRDWGKPDDALRAYARACAVNPALEASWRGQLDILRAKGQDHRAVWVQAQLERLQATPKPVVAVIDLIAQGRLLKAEDICRQFLQEVPHHVEGMRQLAEIGKRLGVLDHAEFLLENAVKIAPNDIPVRIDYIHVLRKRQKFVDALAQAKLLLEQAPDNPQFQSLYAIESMQTGDFDGAIAAFDGVLEKIPGDPITLTSKGHALKTSGNYDDAVTSYRAALQSQPGYGEAWYSLANLKVYEFSEDEIAAMCAREGDSNLSHLDRVNLYFALGKAHEDRADYEQSFHYYEKGNQLKKAQSRYDAEMMTEDLRAQQEVCTAGFFDSRQEWGHSAPDPIFIVGLPRAGSTLLEQILSSHSMVDGTLELPNILSLSQRLRRRGREGETGGYPQVLATIDQDEFREFGEAFIRDTMIHRVGAPFFIDKMPNNFRHIGLIRMILPNAKIIDARRHPMACCFSAFKQLFAEGQEFTYNISDAGQYYRDYVELMAHWEQVLPGFVLRVMHEDVVANLETEVRRMLEFCGLPFEEACLEFHKTERSVRTPSSEQVRQPIYTTSLQQWQHFEQWLDPLKAALGDHVRLEYGLE